LKDKTIIEHRGGIQYETIGELIQKFKNQTQNNGIQMATYKRLLLIMIESLENIMKYCELPEGVQNNNNSHYSVFSIHQNNKSYIITTANPIKRKNITHLAERLDYINALDKQSLKELYKKTITNGQFSNLGGAGLGLIEIAKISDNKINYEFLPINDEFIQLKLVITVDESID
jgi:hypothetical protein